MKDICCYILWSNTLGRFYIGACQENLQQRIDKHNNHSYNEVHFTDSADDWELFLKIDAVDFAQAVRLERKIKAMKSKVYILNLKKYPEMVENLKLKICTTPQKADHKLR
jgi:putative endonuclease